MSSDRPSTPRRQRVPRKTGPAAPSPNLPVSEERGEASSTPPSIDDLRKLRNFWRSYYRSIMFWLLREEPDAYRKLCFALARHGLFEEQVFTFNAKDGPGRARMTPLFPQMMVWACTRPRSFEKVMAFATDQTRLNFKGRGRRAPARPLALLAYYLALDHAKSPGGSKDLGAETPHEYALSRVVDLFGRDAATWQKYLKGERAILRRADPELLSKLKRSSGPKSPFQTFSTPPRPRPRSSGG
jgi:hypothetical protein